MRRAGIVTISVAVLVTGLGAAAYLDKAHTLPNASCGTAATGAPSGGAPLVGSPYTSTNPAALRCFADAAVTCLAASVHLTVNMTDINDDDVYAIRPGGTPGRCEVTDYGQSRMWSAGGSPSPVTVTDCRVAATAAGATITCTGGWLILIPAGPQQDHQDATLKVITKRDHNHGKSPPDLLNRRESE